nr:hypothetical protein [Tanacetum cinerariifolium]
MIIKKDFEIVKSKGERKSLTLKAKKKSSNEESSTPKVKTKSTSWRLETSREKVECPKPPRDNNQKDFVGGSWSDNGKEDDEKDKDETCLMTLASINVHFESSYFSDENSSKIITKNKHLKAIRNSLENEISELKEKLSKLERNKEAGHKCTTCQTHKIDNEKLKDEALKLTQFQKSTRSLNEMLSIQK